MAKKQIVGLVASALILSGCSGIKNELGLTRNSPDEFTVIKRAPLSLPPEYSLRPPSENGTGISAHNANVAKTRDQARSVVFGGEGLQQSEPKDASAEAAFARKAGVTEANPEIRRVINEENGYIVLENQSTVDKILGKKPTKPVDEAVIDAKAEAERLKNNAEAGQPVNTGDVPTIEKKKSTLDKIF